MEKNDFLLVFSVHSPRNTLGKRGKRSMLQSVEIRRQWKNLFLSIFWGGNKLPWQPSKRICLQGNHAVLLKREMHNTTST